MSRRISPTVFTGALLIAACTGSDSSGRPASSLRYGNPLDSLPATVIDSLQAAGERVYAAAEFDSARALFELVLGHARTSEDSAAMAHALTWAAQANYRLSDYSTAREQAEESLDLKLRLSRDDLLFSSYNVLGLIAYDESRLSDAAARFEQAIDVVAPGADSSLAKVRGNLARVHTTLGDYDAARVGLLEARRLARVLEDPKNEGRALINLAMLDQEEGMSLAAVAHLEEAQPLLAAAGDALGEQFRVGQLGSAYAETGALGEALALLDDALQQSRARGVRYDEAANLEQLAALHTEAGNFRRALQLYAEAKEIDLELGLPDELAMNLLATAEIHAELGNTGLARQNALEARRIHEEIAVPMRVLEDLGTLAEISHEAGLREEAHTRLEEADRLAAELGVGSARRQVALVRARLAEREKDPRGVLRALVSALDDRPDGHLSEDWEFHALAARASADLGRSDSAIVVGRRAVAAVERVRGAFASRVLRTTYVRQREAVYADLVVALVGAGRVPEAFAVADAARGRGLIEHLATVRTDDGGGGAGTRALAEGERLLWRIAELNRGLAELDEIAVEERTEADSEEAASLHQALEANRAEYSAALIRADEATRGNPGRLTLLGVRRPETAEIQRALSPTDALLEYLLTPDAVLLFVVRRDTILSLSSQVSREVLASRVRVARRLLGQRGQDPEASRPVLASLYEVLIGPAKEAGALSGIERLIVVPHAELTYLPFAALLDGGGRYVAEIHVVTHLPTASALPTLTDSGERGGASQRTWAFAPFPRALPATAGEVAAIAGTLVDVRTRTGARASERALREALAEAATVHAATHGVLNARNPMFSRIELAEGDGPSRARGASGGLPNLEDDGRLEVHELLEMHINSELVFLSGCETGTGAAWATGFAGGEEYATLAQAFLYAGARNVLATLWRVDDAGAAAFAEAFYRAQANESPSDALTGAQRAMIRHPDYGAPYYWAAYRLTGSDKELSGSQEIATAAVRK